MNDTFLILQKPYVEAIAWVIHQCNGAGLQVLRTFDLQVAGLDHAECPCVHHGTEQCDCQIAVLLVYGDNLQPISLVAHSHDGETRFWLINNPQQRADPRLEAAILKALSSQCMVPSPWVDLSRVT